VKSCVVTATDEHYFSATGVMLKSLNDNYLGENKLDVFIFVPKEILNWKFFAEYTNLNIEVKTDYRFSDEEFLQLKNYIFPEADRITSACIYKFFIADMCSQYSQVVYVDPDCLVLRDISILLNYSLGQNSLAAFHEIQREFSDNLDFKDFAHFNSGVMVINVEYWQKNKVLEKLISASKSFKNWTGAKDQDVFNFVLKGTSIPLPLSHNYLINLYPQLEVEDPLIVHWAGKWKPWLSGCPKSKWKLIWKEYYEHCH